MLKKIVIIDDEPLILAGLSEKINWKSVGCCIVGTASNGTDGLRLIDKLQPDIVISDIVMPGYSGIDLAKYCSEKHLKLKIILLSAYSEFEYAHQAIHLNVEDYILKPVDSEKLIQAVRKATETIENEEKLSKQMSALETEALNARKYISSSLLFEIAQHGISVIQDDYEKYVDNFQKSPGIVLCIKLYNLPKDKKEGLYPEVSRCFSAQLREDNIQTFSGGSEKQIVLFCCLPPHIDFIVGIERIEKSVLRAIFSIKLRFSETDYQKMVYICIISHVYCNIGELHTAYQKCMNFLPVTFFCRSSQILHTDDEFPKSIDMPDGAKIIYHLKNGNTKQMETELKLELKAVEKIRDQDTAMLFLKSLHRNALQAAVKAGMHTFPSDFQIYTEENFEIKSQRISEYLTEICNYIDSSNNFDKRLKLIIEENYNNSSFSLISAAEKLGISSSHLCRVFKKQTGENFLDCLLRVRIEHAKFLLETTSLSNGQIAEKVGFGEGHYFGQVFKKYCDMTPKQYRNNIKKETNL